MSEPKSSSTAEPMAVAGSIRASNGAAFAGLLAQFQERLGAELDSYLRAKVELAAEVGETTRELTEPLRSFVARGGKRLRPALVHFGRRAAGGSAEGLYVEMAVELLHTYLLIHDDIMDRAETRRGGIAAHRLFEREHRSKAWLGDAERHGESVAILLGDLAHSHAVELFLAGGSGDPRAAECFSEMCREVVIGQYLEMTAPQRQNLGREDLLTILRLKSGRYSVERPIQLGVHLGGGSQALLDGLSRYGVAMGEAFQLQDDLLGVFGNRDEVGKPVGGDLAEGKFTVLISVAIDQAGDVDKRVILECLHKEDPDRDEIDRVRGIVEEVGARRKVEEMITERLRRSADELEGLALSAEGGPFFGGLIDYLGERRS